MRLVSALLFFAALWVAVGCENPEGPVSEAEAKALPSSTPGTTSGSTAEHPEAIATPGGSAGGTATGGGS